jgi:hypothetical protein
VDGFPGKHLVHPVGGRFLGTVDDVRHRRAGNVQTASR